MTGSRVNPTAHRWYSNKGNRELQSSAHENPMTKMNIWKPSFVQQSCISIRACTNTHRTQLPPQPGRAHILRDGGLMCGKRHSAIPNKINKLLIFLITTQQGISGDEVTYLIKMSVISSSSALVNSVLNTCRRKRTLGLSNSLNSITWQTDREGELD